VICVAVTCAVLGASLVDAERARAGHMSWWMHDHSSSVIKPRPNGYPEIVEAFGQPCNDRANDARSYWPSQQERGVPGYIYYHPYIDANVGGNIRTHINAAHKDPAVDYGVYGYNCRYIAGTTSWSTHAFGAAIDTNSARNPVGQDRWNGIGFDGVDYGTFIPDIWKGNYPGHRFYWGLKFSTTPDPMHFQYATGY
jgi:hypothetical protein